MGAGGATPHSPPPMYDFFSIIFFYSYITKPDLISLYILIYFSSLFTAWTRFIHLHLAHEPFMFLSHARLNITNRRKLSHTHTERGFISVYIRNITSYFYKSSI